MLWFESFHKLNCNVLDIHNFLCLLDYGIFPCFWNKLLVFWFIFLIAFPYKFELFVPFKSNWLLFDVLFVIIEWMKRAQYGDKFFVLSDKAFILNSLDLLFKWLFRRFFRGFPDSFLFSYAFGTRSQWSNLSLAFIWEGYGLDFFGDGIKLVFLFLWILGDVFILFGLVFFFVNGSELRFLH